MAHTTYLICLIVQMLGQKKEKNRQENVLKCINYIMLLISSCCHQVSIDKNNFLTVFSLSKISVYADTMGSKCTFKNLFGNIVL